LDLPYLDAEEYRLDMFTLQDRMDLAGLLRHAKGKWLMTIGDHPKIRKLYNEFPMEHVKKHTSVPKIISDKRPAFKQLIIRNYEPPRTPFYTAVASQTPLMDLFGIAASA
jgi:DNA adenine methylase